MNNSSNEINYYKKYLKYKKKYLELKEMEGGKRLKVWDITRENFYIRDELSKKNLLKLIEDKKYPGDLSLLFNNKPTKLQKRILNYFPSPPVIKNFVGVKKKKESEKAAKEWKKGLEEQKKGLELVLKTNEYYKNNPIFPGKVPIPDHIVGSEFIRKKALELLDVVNKRLSGK